MQNTGGKILTFKLRQYTTSMQRDQCTRPRSVVYLTAEYLNI